MRWCLTVLIYSADFSCSATAQRPAFPPEHARLRVQAKRIAAPQSLSYARFQCAQRTC